MHIVRGRYIRRSRSRALQLHSGSRIAIVGGGPAGTLFAHFALKLADEADLDIDIAIYDGKNFLRQGPPGCNMCAGVVSETLLARLEGEGIRLPEGRVQRRIDGYCLRTPHSVLPLTHPAGTSGAISTVYRGSGPRFWSGTDGISFDDYLLGHVRDRGVRVVEKVVRNIILPDDVRQPVRLLCGGPGAQTEQEAELVVGAFGLNTALLNRVEAMGFGYRPPRFLRAFQAELGFESIDIQSRMGDRIHVFLLGLDRVRYAALTPKTEHITVSVIGYGDVGLSELREVLDQPVVRGVLPVGESFGHQTCRCRPRIGVAAARKPYTDRLVIVGDASCSRYYKNGIESAFVTAKLAAETAFRQGVSSSALRDGYYRRARRAIVRDNWYGRLLFAFQDLAARNRVLVRAFARLAGPERGDERTAMLGRQLAWDTLTGNVPYRAILTRALDPRLQVALIREVVAQLVSTVGRRVRERVRRRERTPDAGGTGT